jgi:hypothetical protein
MPLLLPIMSPSLNTLFQSAASPRFAATPAIVKPLANAVIDGPLANAADAVTPLLTPLKPKQAGLPPADIALPYPNASPLKKVLGAVISAATLALSLVSMGLFRLPKVPLLSAPFFAMVFGAFIANEALIALADKAKIPTIHHTESLRRLLSAPGNVVGQKMLQRIWPVFFGGQQAKQAYLEDFQAKNQKLVSLATRFLIQNPMFEDLSTKLRDKRNFGDKAAELGQSFGKVLVALAVGSLLPKRLRLMLTPWLSGLLGLPLLQGIMQQFDQDPTKPGVQLTKGKPTDKSKTKPSANGKNANTKGSTDDVDDSSTGTKF